MAATLGFLDIPASGVNPVAVWNNTISSVAYMFPASTMTDADTGQKAPVTTANGLLTQPSVGGCRNGSGTGIWLPIADSSVAIGLSGTGTTQLVAGVTGKQIYVIGFDLISGGTGTAQFVHGTGNTALTGAYPLVADAGVARNGVGAIWILPAGDNLSVILGGASPSIYGSLSYMIA